MSNYSIGDVVLVRYPFTDLSSSKIRPAIVVSAPHASIDIFVVPITSKTTSLQSGEFALADWSAAGLHVVSAVKRGIYTVQHDFVAKRVGKLSNTDLVALRNSLRQWFGL